MSPDHFHVPNSDRDLNVGTAAYFSVVVHATVGFGDIYPISKEARAAVALHIALIILGSLGIYLFPIEKFLPPKNSISSNLETTDLGEIGSLPTGLHML